MRDYSYSYFDNKEILPLFRILADIYDGFLFTLLRFEFNYCFILLVSAEITEN